MSQFEFADRIDTEARPSRDPARGRMLGAEQERIMFGSRGSSAKSYEERRAELIEQLRRLEAKQDDPSNPLSPEQSKKLANVIRWQIQGLDEQMAGKTDADRP